MLQMISTDFSSHLTLAYVSFTCLHSLVSFFHGSVNKHYKNLQATFIKIGFTDTE